jgi:hypothetical protein
MEHEAPVELCREHPDVVPAILHHLLKVPLPYFSHVRVTDPNTRALVATGKRSDAAVILEDGKRPVLAAILEPQGKIDPDKFYAIMTPDRCRRMQELMMFNPDAILPKTEFDIFQFNKGKAKGKGEAKADAVLRILQRRFGYANESLNQRLHAETRIDLLDTWFDDALTIADEPALHRLVEQILSTPLPPAAD